MVPANRANQIWSKSSSLFFLTQPGHNSNKCNSSINKISSTSYSKGFQTPFKMNSFFFILSTYLDYFCLPHGRPRGTSFPSSPVDLLLFWVGKHLNMDPDGSWTWMMYFDQHFQNPSFALYFLYFLSFQIIETFNRPDFLEEIGIFWKLQKN